MNELTIVKVNGGAYIDSRQVAEIIGKNHKELLRDIRRYDEILSKKGQRNFAPTSFFVESYFTDKWNRKQPCYLITRRGADVIAHKLTGEKGVLFTAAYVTKFYELGEREHEREIAEIKAQSATPKLTVFNAAVRSVLDGMNYSEAPPRAVMDFLRGAYKPFGIAVNVFGSCDGYYSAGVIARILKLYSYTGRPHAQAVSAIIAKLNFDPDGHIEIVPYGLVGFSVRYDDYIAQAVADWLERHDYPHDIPHNGIEYHVYYENPYEEYEYDYDSQISLDDDFEDYE
jgi:Rha family phage regulatory protein